MVRNAWIVATLALVACNSDKTDDSGAIGGDGTPGACTTEVSDTFPKDGATDHYYLANIEFALSEADATATVTVTDAGGAAVSGSTWTSEDGETVYFTPTGGFTPSSSYSATISICSGSLAPSIGFTTSDLGTARACDLTDQAYLIDLTKARFVEPAGVADLLLGNLTNSVLLGVSDYTDASNLDIIGAISTSGTTEQDFCTPSLDFTGVDFSSDPTFTLGPADTELVVQGYSIKINSLEIGGTFSSDCSYFGGGSLAGELDARELAPLLLELLDTDDPDYICQLLQGFSVTCGPCTSDSQPYCLSILADSIVATEIASNVECVPGDDCNAQCATNSTECDTTNYPTCD